MKKLKVNFYLKGDKKNADGNIAIYAKIYLGSAEKLRDKFLLPFHKIDS